MRGQALPFARYGLRGTVAARFWIYQRRDPTALIFWGMNVITMMIAAPAAEQRLPELCQAAIRSKL